MMNKTTIIGVFDDPIALEKTINKLNEKGLQWSVFDPNVVAQGGGTGVAPPISTPGVVPAPGGVGAAGSFSQRDRDAVINAFKDHLSSLHLSRKAIDAYVDQFTHEAKLVSVRVDEKLASEVIELIQAFNPSQINRHD
jgi:hypothetical protein